ncbi:hypothetical protein Tco_0517252 [Tanacetum coccineum]
MEALKFADSHNMVAYLDKSTKNVDFDEIVNFLNANPIRYALTVSPTIYASYIEQFWSTTKTKTVNNETQIRAKVDGKTIVITESSMRRDLYFNNEDVVFNDEYDTPSHTKKVFANMIRKGKDFSETVTPLFPSMLGTQAVEGEGSGQPTKPQHNYYASPFMTVYEERRDKMERATTTASSLEAEHDSGSGPRHQDTILGDTPAQTSIIGLMSEPVITASAPVAMLVVSVKERKEKLVMLHDLKTWDIIKARIDANDQLAKRLQAEEREHIMLKRKLDC